MIYSGPPIVSRRMFVASARYTRPRVGEQKKIQKNAQQYTVFSPGGCTSALTTHIPLSWPDLKRELGVSSSGEARVGGYSRVGGREGRNATLHKQGATQCREKVRAVPYVGIHILAAKHTHMSVVCVCCSLSCVL